MRLESKIAAALLSALILSVLVGWIAQQSSRTLLHDLESVTHTREVLEQIEGLSAAWNNAESARRGYVLIGDPIFKGIVDSALADVSRLWLELEALTRDNPRQQRRLERMQSLIDEKSLQLKQSLIDWDRRGDAGDSLQRATTVRGTELTVRFGTIISEMRADEFALLDMRRMRAVRSERTARWFVIVMTVMASLNAIIGGAIILRDVHGRRKVERDLQELNRELKSFSYSVSHDLKAPIRGIRGYAQELQRKCSAVLPDRGQFCITQIMAGVDHVDRLIEDLLSYSRVAADQPSRTRVHLPALIEQLARQFDHALKLKNLKLKVELAFQELTAWERGLRQALENLLDNAVKYSRAEGGEISIVASETSKSWQLMVSDTGIGFDPANADRIFDLFHRLVSESDYPGTGAGLAIARRVIEKQDGRIRAESEPGRGSRFYIDLPKHNEPKTKSQSSLRRG